MKYSGNRNYRDYELVSEEKEKKENVKKKPNILNKLLKIVKK